MTANAEEAALLGNMGAGSEVVFLGLFGMTMTIFAYIWMIGRFGGLKIDAGYEEVEMEKIEGESVEA
ncbi:hypothetical protein L207DRAFT_574885 [Hyaloscypha variabilis F]|uniref:Uncharacterized protein n=1 Tax=Hyaloscypha variabilis (strain UAMH 11265 / GT02V1 / F) TaxID=1149755 RepID=A0A2J6SBS1_HYAVF|nr:hypothetical protein L207DRAFT_574885 [Hyaloscypha variabilis F]